MPMSWMPRRLIYMHILSELLSQIFRYFKFFRFNCVATFAVLAPMVERATNPNTPRQYDSASNPTAVLNRDRKASVV